MNKSDFSVVVIEDDDSLRSEIVHLVASIGFPMLEASCAEELDEIAVDTVPARTTVFDASSVGGSRSACDS